jgi:hypothetical protein
MAPARGISMPEYARFSSLQVDPDRIDEAVSFFKGTDLAGASSMAGFRRAFWMLDRATGKGAELVVFESKDALDGATEEESEARAEARGITFSAVETYEVVAEGGPPRA